MPANKAGLFSFITINWLTRMMWKAFRKGLTQEDFYDLDVSASQLDENLSDITYNRMLYCGVLRKTDILKVIQTAALIFHLVLCMLREGK